MLKQINLKPAYFIPVFVMLLSAFVCCTVFSKQISFLVLNNYHTKWLDVFFANYTLAGDGCVSIAAVVLLIFFHKQKAAVTLLLGYAGSGLAAQLIKHCFNYPRPKLYFEQSKVVYHHFVEGVVANHSGSFPSGHTASAFAMATVFALLSCDKRISIIAFVFAALVGYSRIYLAEHFLQDVVAGAFIGVFWGMLSYYLIWQKKKPFIQVPAFTKKTHDNSMA